MAYLHSLITLFRVRHWIKNILVVVPVVFAERLDWATAGQASLAFLSFSLLSSAVYAANDIADKDSDSHHPTKKSRPVASGAISVPAAAIAAVTLVIASASIGLRLGHAFTAYLAVYGILNAAYSFGLKRIVIIDVMIIAMGFVLRVLAGTAAISVQASPWIIICTFFAALFLGFGKRKGEVDVLQDKSHKHRSTLSHYTPDFSNQLIGGSATMAIISYTLYSIDPETVERFHSKDLLYTIPFVVLGFYRYFFLLYNRTGSGEPITVFSKDAIMIGTIALWFATFFLIIKLS